MNRRNSNHCTGCINWPSWLKSSGEGGSYVYAIAAEKDFDKDEFLECISHGAHLIHDSTVDPDLVDLHKTDEYGQIFPLERRLFPGVHLDEDRSSSVEKYLSIPLLCALCLGTSGGTFYSEDPFKMWHCQEKDLTEDGLQLVQSLKKLYNRNVELITFIDT